MQQYLITEHRAQLQAELQAQLQAQAQAQLQAQARAQGHGQVQTQAAAQMNSHMQMQMNSQMHMKMHSQTPMQMLLRPHAEAAPAGSNPRMFPRAASQLGHSKRRNEGEKEEEEYDMGEEQDFQHVLDIYSRVLKK